jgi:hypothetical protein
MTRPSALTPPTTADESLLAFANAAEFAARDLYAAAANMPMFGKEESAMLVGFHDHHRAAAQAFAGLVGSAATNEPSTTVYNAFRNRLTGDDKNAIFTVLRELENTLVSTHTALVGVLEGTAGIALVASVLTIQARHAVVLAQLAGESLSETLSNSQAALAPGAGS